MKENPRVTFESKQGTTAEPGCIAAIRQTSDLRRRWEWAEPTIWTDNMLKALENGVKGRKWFSLIDKVERLTTLQIAWEKVRSNRGAAGIDQVTIDRFTAKASTYLKELQKDLQEGRYRPQPVRRVYIPKEPGKTRPLGIPTIKDRIVQMAIKMAIEPIFEKEFLPTSFGFRPRMGAQEAVETVNELIKEGYTHVVDADLKGYFDTIPHKRLMDLVRDHVSDGRVLKLIESFLNQEVMDGLDRWTPVMGTPQGAVISPLLANIYLHQLDLLMAHAGLRMVRYADDFVILCKSREEAERGLRLTQEWVAYYELTLHPDKTHIGNCMLRGEGFEFLGFRFECGYLDVRKKSLQKMRDKIRGKTRRTCGKSLKSVIADLNPILRGWIAYFWPAGVIAVKQIDGFTRRRLRGILRKQQKRPGHGHNYNDHKTWPNTFFAKSGLFSVVDYLSPHRGVSASM